MENKYNNPNHYKLNGIDTMDIILSIVESNCETTRESIFLFNVLKYLIRYSKKDGSKDLEKAADYLNRLTDIVKIKEAEIKLKSPNRNDTDDKLDQITKDIYKLLSM